MTRSMLLEQSIWQDILMAKYVHDAITRPFKSVDSQWFIRSCKIIIKNYLNYFKNLKSLQKFTKIYKNLQKFTKLKKSFEKF